MKHFAAILSAALALTLGLAGCAPAAPSPSGSGSSAPAPVEAKPVLLAVSFGTSYNDSRDITIGAIEKALETAYPDYEMRRAFTSQIIIDKLAERDNLAIDNVTEAMERLVADGVKRVVVQPTHVMSGFEYDDVVREVTAFADKLESLTIGLPLLSAEADYDRLVGILAEETAAYNAEGTAVVFMGHGTEHASNAVYAALQQKLVDAGHVNYLVGTVEAEPTLEDVMAQLEAQGVQKVVLLPLMIVAGDHANNDMAGDEEDSWKTVLEAAGYEVEPLLQGMGQYAGVQQLFVEHAAAAMAK